MSVHELTAKHEQRINELYEMVGHLQKWQSTVVENWMRRIESILDTQAEGFNKWQCPNCKEPFADLADFLEHIIANMNQIEKKTTQLPTVYNNMTQAVEMLENLAKRVEKIELFISEQQAKANEAREVIKGLAFGLKEAKVSEDVRPEIVSEFLEKSISILEPEKPASTTPPYPTETGEPSTEDLEDD